MLPHFKIQTTIYHIINYKFNSMTTNIEFSYDNKVYNVETNLLSKFNIYNYITALAFVNNIGFSIDDIIKVIHLVEEMKR